MEITYTDRRANSQSTLYMPTPCVYVRVGVRTCERENKCVFGGGVAGGGGVLV